MILLLMFGISIDQYLQLIDQKLFYKIGTLYLFVV